MHAVLISQTFWNVIRMFLELSRYFEEMQGESRLSSHLDLYTAVSTVALRISGGLVAFFSLLAASPDEWAEPKHIRLSSGQASLLKNVIRVL